MPDGPKLTEKDLEEDGFGAKPFFECLVAYDPAKPDKLVGFVLFFYTYSTWEGKAVFMEDLYVTPTYRGKGIGTNLWKGVVQVSSNFQNNKIYIRQIGKYMNKMKPIFLLIRLGWILIAIDVIGMFWTGINHPLNFTSPREEFI